MTTTQVELRDEIRNIIKDFCGSMTTPGINTETYDRIEAYKDNACEEAFKRGYIAGSIDQVNKSEEK